MTTGRRGTGIGSGAGCILLLALLVLPAPARAGDVPAGVEAAYATAAGLVDKGRRADLESAFQALDARKDDALASVDFWVLYARLWLMLDKDGRELWDTVIKERQARAPTSTVFDLVRFRLTRDVDEKRTWLDAALKRNKEDVRARVAKGRFLVEQGEEDDGAEILEAVLEDAPGCEPALLALAELSLSEGFPDEAIEFIEEGIEAQETPGLWHMAARCWQRKAQDKDREASLGKALDAAAHALGLAPNERYIKHYDELLKLTGDAATATKALKEHFARTQHPMLAALLADSAFRAGDYEAAVLGLQAADGRDLVNVKALATAHARLGHAVEARQQLAKVLEMDTYGRLFAARTELWLGNAAAALGHLGSLADEEAVRLRARAHGWAGDVDEAKALGAKQARTGSRDGEHLLIAWFQARLFDRMGAQLASAVRTKLLDARFKAGREIVTQGGDYSATLGDVKTAGWPRRAVTYFRSSCGTWFKVSGDYIGRTFETVADAKTMTVYRTVSGETTCGEAKHGFQVQFNGKSKPASDNGWIELFSDDQNEAKLVEFEPAEKAFAAACAAWLDGDGAAAEAACAKALRVEPGFSRVKVYRAIGRALAPDGERRADASDAAKAVAVWTDDFELRRLVILLRAWAGDADLGKEIEALARREARMSVRVMGDL